VIDFLESGLPIAEASAVRAGALAPPPELVEVHAIAAAKRVELAALLRSTVQRVRGGEDAAAVLAANQPRLDALAADLDDLATRAGVPECADGPAPARATPTPTTGAAAPAERGAVLATTPGDAEIQRFEADVAAAEGALAVVDGALAGTVRPDGLRVLAPALRRAHDDFAAAASRMDSYTLADAASETRRTRLATEAPKVGDIVEGLLDAVTAGDRASVRRLAPLVRTRIHSFWAAVHPRSS
jgi:hypothetical protein